MPHPSTAVVEHAEISIDPARSGEFEAAFARGHAAIRQSPGYRWARLVRQVEDGSRYLLLIEWDRLESHTVDFRGSELFATWRAEVGPFFAETPVVVHYGAEPVGGDGGADWGADGGTDPGTDGDAQRG